MYVSRNKFIVGGRNAERECYCYSPSWIDTCSSSPPPPALSQEGLPVITQHPTGGIYSTGDTVRLTCQAEGPSVNAITWYHNGDQVDTGPTHDIPSFTAAEAGTYTCRATTNGVGTVTSALAKLQLAGRSTITLKNTLFKGY